MTAMTNQLKPSYSDESTIQLPRTLDRPFHWLACTLEDKIGQPYDDDYLFDVPLRHLVLKGGRGSGKSHSIARMLVHLSTCIPIRVLCTREIQKSIDESVYMLLRDVISELGYADEFTIQSKTIEHENGSRFLFAGLREHDIQKVRSTERISVCWCEEAHVLSKRSLDVLIPTIREKNSVIIYSYNPELDDDPVHARYGMSTDEDVCVVHMNYTENEWFPQVLESERQRDFERDKTRNKDIYNWVWEGMTLPAVEGAIFATEMSDFQDDHRIIPLDYDSTGKAYAVMDLGYGVMTFAMWQRFGSTMQLFDYYEFYKSSYAKLTSVVTKDHPHIRWGSVFMPHDASHRDPKTEKSHFQVMEELGWTTAKIPQIGVENYIERGRGLFETAYISNRDVQAVDYPDIDYARGCNRLVQCLKRFRYQMPVTTNQPTNILKDEFSHGGETWCYSAVVAEEMINEQRITDPYVGLR